MTSGPLKADVNMDWIPNVVLTEKLSRQIRMHLNMRHANLAIKESHTPGLPVHVFREHRKSSGLAIN